VAIPPEAWVIDGKGLTFIPVSSILSPMLASLLLLPPAVKAGPVALKKAHAVRRTVQARAVAQARRTKSASATSASNLAKRRLHDRGIRAKGDSFRQAAVLDLGGERAGDLVVKSPVAIPVSLQISGGFGSGFPDSLMAVSVCPSGLAGHGLEHQDASDYEKNPRGVERPRYDRTEAALADALEDHAVVLIPANNSVQLRRALELVDRWHVNGVLYGGQMAYEVAPEVAAKKLSVLVNLKWPEGEKDADPEDKPSLRTLQFRDRAPSSPGALAKAGVKFAFYSGGIATRRTLLRRRKNPLTRASRRKPRFVR